MANGIQLIPGSQRNAFIAQGINNYLAGILQQAQQKQFAQDLPTILAIAQKAQSGQQILPQEFANIKSPQALQILSSSLTRSAMTPLQEAQREYYLSRAKQPPSPQTRVVGDELYERDPTTQQWTPTGIKAAPTPSEQIGQERVSIISKLKPKIETGTATAEEKATYEDAVLGRPISVQVGTEKVAPKAYYDELSQAITIGNTINDLLEMTKPGGASETMVGAWNQVVRRIVKEPFGLYSVEEQQFKQKYIQLQNIIRQLNVEGRLSDQDYERLKSAIPGEILNDKAFKAGLGQLKEDNDRKMQRTRKIIEELGYNLPEVLSETTSSKDISQMSDEELNKIAGIE